MNTQILALILVSGIAISFLGLIAIVSAYDYKKNPRDYPRIINYDERQLADQAKAMKYAFFTIAVYLLLWGILELFGIVLWVSTFGAFLGVMLGLGVLTVISILCDAFFRPDKKIRKIMPWLISFDIFAFGMINLSKLNELKGDYFKDGILKAEAYVWLIFLYLFMCDAALIVRAIIEKKEKRNAIEFGEANQEA